MLKKNLSALKKLGVRALKEQRYQKFRQIGQVTEGAAADAAQEAPVVS